MPTLSSTLTTMRQGLNDYLGLTYRGTTTSAGAADGTTFIDATNLVNYQDNRFQYWWALITSGSASGEVRRVASSTKSTGTITLESGFSVQIGSGVSYELMPYHPTNEIRWALNRALQEAFPNLRRSYINEDLITGNVLRDSGGEEWDDSSTPTFWTYSGTITFAQETAIKRYGTRSMKVTSGLASSFVYQDNAKNPSLEDLAGQTVDYYHWVRTDTASHARLQIRVTDEDGTSSTYSGDYHPGNSQWQLLKVTAVPIPETVRYIQVCITADVNGGVAYIDQGRILSTHVSTYVLPSVFQNKPPERVLIQTYGVTSTSDEAPCDDLGETAPYREWTQWRAEYDEDLGLWLLRFTQVPPVGYKIRLVGTEYIGTVTSDSDTVPLNQPQLNLLYPLAAYRLHMRLAYDSTGQAREDYLKKAADNWRDYQILLGAHRQLRPKVVPDFGNWR